MTLNFVHTRNLPIFKQLELEEALLRANQENWCIVNEGSTPAIVMGISGKPEELIRLGEAEENGIPVIKRFSGGGTVIVDESTLFVSFLFQKEVHPFPAYPEPIMKWSEELYQKVFSLDAFHLKENDYVIGDKKCGGNAQYIKKDRWLHHTSFLWDYKQHFMNVLLHPKKTPNYRNARSHDDFLCKLKDHMKDQSEIIENLKKELSSRFQVNFLNELEAFDKIKEPYRKTTTVLSIF